MKKRFVPIPVLLTILLLFSFPIRGNASTGTVSGTVFDDANKNGVQDADENGVSDVKINLLDINNSQVSSMTDTDGNYIFEQVQDGDHAVYITYHNGWISTAQVVMVSIESGGSASINFGVKPYPTPEPALPPSEPIIGDANNDGELNALDITEVERLIAGLD